MRIIGLLAALAIFAVPGAAGAWTLTPPYLSYTATFECDSMYPGTTPSDDFSTTITVHNPHPGQVSFAEWFGVSSILGGNPPREPAEVQTALAANTSTFVNCQYIRAVLHISPERHNVKGFITVEVPPQSSGAQPPAMDVVATYLVKATDRSAAYVVESIVPGNLITF